MPVTTAVPPDNVTVPIMNLESFQAELEQVVVAPHDLTAFGIIDESVIVDPAETCKPELPLTTPVVIKLPDEIDNEANCVPAPF